MQWLSSLAMVLFGLILVVLGVWKKYEPLLLVPIGFGAILANIPGSAAGVEGGILEIIYRAGIENDLFPCLIFIGVGAMIDFKPLIGNPGLLVFAAAGQMGIFISMLLALVSGFSLGQAASIGIIGAMDGPSAIYLTSRLAPELLGPVTVCAYSYMSMVPIIQRPISKLLTSRRERLVRMSFKEFEVPWKLKVSFPIIVTLLTGLVAPEGLPLMGSLMFGNLLRETGVTDRLSQSAQNELVNIVTMLLGLGIGYTLKTESFLRPDTLLVFAYGLVAFASAIGSGLIIGKVAYYLTGRRFNPLVGACGVSAFPMAARTAHGLGREEDPDNWLLPAAVAANTGGQVGSVVATGILLNLISRLVST